MINNQLTMRIFNAQFLGFWIGIPCSLSLIIDQ